MAFNRNEVEGKGRKAVGVAKEKLGRATGNPDLEQEGVADQTSGGFQAGVGKVARKINNVVNDAADDLSKH